MKITKIGDVQVGSIIRDRWDLIGDMLVYHINYHSAMGPMTAWVLYKDEHNRPFSYYIHVTDLPRGRYELVVK